MQQQLFAEKEKEANGKVTAAIVLNALERLGYNPLDQRLWKEIYAIINLEKVIKEMPAASRKPDKTKKKSATLSQKAKLKKVAENRNAQRAFRRSIGVRVYSDRELARMKRFHENNPEKRKIDNALYEKRHPEIRKAIYERFRAKLKAMKNAVAGNDNKVA